MRSQINSHRNTEAGLTLLELVIVIVILAGLALVILPALKPDRHNRDPIFRCLNNLKQVGLAFRLWAIDNGDKFPMQVPVARNGTQEFVADPRVAPHLIALSNEIFTPKILVCWAANISPATNFTSLAETNLGYFLNLEAKADAPEGWLTGDRSLTLARQPVRGMATLTASSEINWSESVHRRRGVIALADGSARIMDSKALANSIRTQTNFPLRLVFPD